MWCCFNGSRYLLFAFIFQSIPESFSESETYEGEQAAEDESQDKESDTGSDAFEDVQSGILIEDDGTALQYDTDDLSDFESEGSDVEFDGETEDDQGVKSPLFLQLTCTLRDRSTHRQPMHPVSINRLPVCLGKEDVTLSVNITFTSFVLVMYLLSQLSYLSVILLFM